MDLQQLKNYHHSNSYFSAPREWGQNTPQNESPRFIGNSSSLINALSEIALKEPRTKIIKNDLSSSKIQLCQRSLVFRFPDIIWVQGVNIDEVSSSIAIYSSAKYGKYDFGVNQRRVIRWIKKLTEKIPITSE